MIDLIKKTFSLARALATGEVVSDERLLKRMEICAVCPKVRKTPNDEVLACGICGCKLKGDRRLINLALYEETPQYGCKYPGGSKWKAYRDEQFPEGV